MPTTEPTFERWQLHLVVAAIAIYWTILKVGLGLPLCPSAGGPPKAIHWGFIAFLVLIMTYVATFTALRLKGKWQQLKTATGGLSTRIWFAMDGLLLAGLLVLIGLLLFSESAHAQFYGFCFDPK